MRVLAASFFWAVLALAIVVGGVAATSGSQAGGEGGTPYTPTKGEWLCLCLTAQQALANSEQEPPAVPVRYRYDKSQPDAVVIELVVADDATPAQVRNRAAEAKQRSIEAAKRQGWDGWLKIEYKETKPDGQG